jgi:hypothetical protein
MCHAVTCKTCTKPTWAGCGRHVESALAGVPTSDRCPGHPQTESQSRLGRFFGGRS